MASSAPPDVTSRFLKHQRLIVAVGIALLVGVSWWFLATGAGMAGHPSSGMDMGMMAAPPFSALVVMWFLMMVAMMVPSAAPAILLYGRVRAIRSRDGEVAATAIFFLGYLAIWFLFSIAAAAAQQALTGSSMMLADPAVQSAVLIAAGLYQLSPVKSACLRQCRAPAQFISRHWRSGPLGAARLGVLHGAYCVGCCWLLMALLFVGGVMNFAWIAALTLIVGAEKLLPRGDWIARLAGVALIGWGAWRLAA